MAIKGQSFLTAAGLPPITISVTVSFCSTMRAVVIRCANCTAVIGAKGGIIGIVSTEAVIGAAGAMKRQRRYTEDTTPGANGWRDRHDARVCDGSDYSREGWTGGNHQWRGGGGRGTGVTPAPNTDALQGLGRGRRQDYGNVYGRSDRPGREDPNEDPNVDTVPASRRQGSVIQEDVASVEELPEPSPNRKTHRHPANAHLRAM
jgi:hypothetical protein